MVIERDNKKLDSKTALLKVGLNELKLEINDLYI